MNQLYLESERHQIQSIFILSKFLSESSMLNHLILNYKVQFTRKIMHTFSMWLKRKTSPFWRSVAGKAARWSPRSWTPKRTFFLQIGALLPTKKKRKKNPQKEETLSSIQRNLCRISTEKAPWSSLQFSKRTCRSTKASTFPTWGRVCRTGAPSVTSRTSPTIWPSTVETCRSPPWIWTSFRATRRNYRKSSTTCSSQTSVGSNSSQLVSEREPVAERPEEVSEVAHHLVEGHPHAQETQPGAASEGRLGSLSQQVQNCGTFFSWGAPFRCSSSFYFSKTRF